VTCKNTEQTTVENMEVDASANKVKTAVGPKAVEVTLSPVSTKNSASSKPAKKRITPIAIN
jgi:chromatin assembly factor 1 subunit B